MKMHGWVVTQAALECGVAVLLKHSSAHQTKIAQLEASHRLHVVLNNIAHFIRPLGVCVLVCLGGGSCSKDTVILDETQ